MKLHELHIQNFKFFPKHDPKSPLLKIGGKNLLIYGENGSGKSTIYWAIYTLLESAFKDGNDGKQKIKEYFTKGHEKGLVNIHTTTAQSQKPYVKAVLDDGAGNQKEYLINGEDATITAIQGNSDVRESGMASDFINYRVLFRLHHVKHSKDNNLFGWFEDEIFPYIIIDRISRVNSLGDVYKDIKQGPKKVKDFDEPDTEVYPNQAMRLHPEDAVKKNYKKYQAYERKLKKFNRKFKGYLRERVIRANEILQNDFGQNFEIKLDYEPARASITADKLNWADPKVILKIPRYEGRRNVVKRAHSFLNEAKWTSIGLSIRFAILEDWTNRPNTAELKLLTIDDMLLSLDMSNRDVVLNLLLNRYSADYQLLMMTHDRSFYEFAKRKIETSGKKGGWLVLEMYQDNLAKRAQPYFKPLKTSLQTAEDYFKQHDYPACSIYLRKEIERCLTNLLPPKYRKVPSRDDVNVLVDAKLNDMLLNLEAYCIEDGIDYSELSDLKTFKDALLNPLAHNDLDTPLFRDELKKLMKAISILEKKDRARPFHRSNKNMNFNLTKPDGSYFSVRMKSKEQVMLLEEEGKPPRISVFSKCKVSGIDNNGTVTNYEENFDTLKEVYNDMCTRFGIGTQQDISRKFDYDGKTFDQKIAEMGL
ncbi:hypothetical protein DZC72_13235 [Maribacter algicola]|uniref:RecF/RecN/SMC N-terminal domain-containing protein n=1 Tax=Maribacter algicola TaxID=2498892 RepID=A0A3R8R7E5_9FLAO|nr:ATP-binding protein [Maribacter algicola]RRQ48645.1 hypothetical protein DZC72_13235 [Maribacter algicola]